MSSKNNKPINTPVNKDNNPQTTSTSGTNKPVSNKVNNEQKSGIDTNKSTAGNANDKKTTTDKSSASTSTNSIGTNKTTSSPASATKNDPSKDPVKTNDTLAKPAPASSKPLNAAKPATTDNASTANSNKDKAKKASDSTGNSKAANTTAGSSKGNGSTTPPPSKPSSPKQSPLPLIISLIALGVGGYALYNSMQQPRFNPEEVQKLQAQVTELQKSTTEQSTNNDLTELRNNINNLESQLAELQKAPDSPAGLDEAQVQTLIAQQVDQAKQSLQNSLQDSIASQPQQATQPELSKEQVSTMIKEAILNNTAAQNDNTPPVIDFSSEIETIRQNRADIEQYLQQIKQQGESLKSSLTETAEQAKSSLNEAANQAEQKITEADQRPVVYPLINALTLAEVASNARQYGVASQYLQQAKASFDDLHLNQPPYADFAGQIDELAQKTDQLAKQQNNQQDIDGIINSVNNWAFISTNPENVLDNKPSDKPTESWKDDIKHIGNSILSSTVTITKNDAAGLTWVNENPHLQQIIRENVRLDLAMIRNALLIGDQERAQQIAATLHEEVGRYFDTEAAEVKQAMNKLDELTQQESDAPDIAALIQSIQQAG